MLCVHSCIPRPCLDSRHCIWTPDPPSDLNLLSDLSLPSDPKPLTPGPSHHPCLSLLFTEVQFTRERHTSAHLQACASLNCFMTCLLHCSHCQLSGSSSLLALSHSVSQSLNLSMADVLSCRKGLSHCMLSMLLAGVIQNSRPKIELRWMLGAAHAIVLLCSCCCACLLHATHNSCSRAVWCMSQTHVGPG